MKVQIIPDPKNPVRNFNFEGNPIDVVRKFQTICVPRIAGMSAEEYCEFFNQAHGYKDDLKNPEKVVEALAKTSFLKVL
jgi:hypothetical protein